MQDYKDLRVWKGAHDFVLSIYKKSKSFPREETYALTNQLRRSAVSIAANIAEGCGKKTQKEFQWFLNVSLGSVNESEYFLLLSRDLNYLPENDYQELYKEINIIRGMLIRLIEKVKTKV